MNILEYIPTGEQNATSLDDIARESGLTIEETTDAITAAIKADNVILKKAEYFFKPQSIEELMDFAARLPFEFQFTQRIWQIRYLKIIEL